MPLQHGKDTTGNYYRFGPHGKKYYYDNAFPIQKSNARIKAMRQGAAISISKKKRK